MGCAEPDEREGEREEEWNRCSECSGWVGSGREEPTEQHSNNLIKGKMLPLSGFSSYSK